MVKVKLLLRGVSLEATPFTFRYLGNRLKLARQLAAANLRYKHALLQSGRRSRDRLLSVVIVYHFVYHYRLIGNIDK